MTNQSIHDDRAPDVTIRTTAGLIASVPALMGFAPQDSLVLIAQHGRGGRGRHAAVLRADLPTDDAVLDERLVEALRSRVASTGAVGVHLLVVTEAGDDGALPHVGMVDAVREAFTGSGIIAGDGLWTPEIADGAPWACYGPCGCTGTLPDPGATELAAHQALLGKVTYRSREEVEGALAPEPAAASARARQLLDSAHDRAQTARALDRARARREDLDAVRAAAATVGAGQRPDENTLARVVVALRDPAVRDVCLGFVLDTDPAVRAGHAEQLWWLLTRSTPGPEVAEPATLLALTALLRGGGAVVTVALERARDADPGHRLSGLVGQMIDRAIDPATVRQTVTDVVAEASAQLAG